VIRLIIEMLPINAYRRLASVNRAMRNLLCNSNAIFEKQKQLDGNSRGLWAQCAWFERWVAFATFPNADTICARYAVIGGHSHSFMAAALVGRRPDEWWRRFYDASFYRSMIGGYALRSVSADRIMAICKPATNNDYECANRYSFDGSWEAILRAVTLPVAIDLFQRKQGSDCSGYVLAAFLRFRKPEEYAEMMAVGSTMRELARRYRRGLMTNMASATEPQQLALVHALRTAPLADDVKLATHTSFLSVARAILDERGRVNVRKYGAKLLQVAIRGKDIERLRYLITVQPPIAFTPELVAFAFNPEPERAALWAVLATDKRFDPLRAYSASIKPEK